MLLAGCGGGGSNALAPRPVDNTTAPLQTAHATIILGGKSGTPTAGARRPKFVSPSTNGIDIKVMAHGGNTIIGESRTDISSGSAACGAQTGLPRTCTIAVPAPPGNDDFVATTYDAAPVSNSFSAAHPLGSGGTTQSITPGASNSFTLFISGIINQLGFLPPNASLPADGATHTLGFVLNPADFDANPITAGPNDPYANPITVLLTESGGSGHVQIVKNGTPTGTTSTTLNKSTDTVAVQYDGGGAVGYNVAVAVSSTSVTTETLTISPMFVMSPSPFHSGNTLAFTATGQTATVNFSETGAAASTTYTATPAGSCATASAPTPTGSAASTTVTAAASGTCTIAFSDGSSTITWNISVSTTSGTVVVPGYAVGPISFDGYSLGSLNGQQGWQTNSCGGNDYDAAVVNTSSYNSANWSGYPTPTKALRFSNAVTQNCFSGLGSPVTPHAAGYPNALADESGATPTICGADCQPYFSMQFVVTSATGAAQPQLEMSLSPVYNNQGARMSYVGLWHGRNAANNADKLIVFAYDVEGVCPPGTTATCGNPGPAPCFQCVNFTVHEIAEVDPTQPHKIGLAMQFVQPNADVVKYYVDNVQSPTVSTSYRSWEDYYLFDTESDPGFANPVSRAVNDVLFRAGSVEGCLNYADLADPTASNCSHGSSPGITTHAGNGFLITDVTTCAATASVCAPAIQTTSFRRSTQSFSPATNGTAVRFRGVKLLR